MERAQQYNMCSLELYEALHYYFFISLLPLFLVDSYAS